jgi:PhnB protein
MVPGMTEPVTLRPRLVVPGAARAIDYYTQALGATELARYQAPDGRIVHAELALGATPDAPTFTLKDEDGTDPAPARAGGCPVLLMLDADDPDAVASRMVAGGATVIFPVSDSDHGRGGRLADPFGHVWMISGRGA